MTKQKAFKRQVRARMVKTSESYTAARHQLLRKSASPEPEPAAAPVDTGIKPIKSSDEALVSKTGKRWDEWFSLLDAWGAVDRKHPEVARWLVEEHGVPGWWAQEITVAFEQERGIREPGQRPDGKYNVNASKTVNVPIDGLFEAFANPALREQWLPGAKLEVTTSVAEKSFRAKWGDAGTGRLSAGFYPKGDGKSMVAVAIEKVDTPEEAAALKTYWAERMKALRSLLEG